MQEGRSFGEGARYTRDSYRAMADVFATKYMAEHPRVAAEGARLAEEKQLSPARADARALEEEFWRIVETNTEEVQVEYGSDLDADVYGSGFAVLPAGSSARDGPDTAEDEEDDGVPHAWDFGALVEHPSNLLRVIGANIPGLTRPWLYLGMMFAAFCWHVEDHYLGSINYLHAGACKTWYGVPGAAAGRFERAVRTVLAGVVRATPDLLHRLVTLVPPAVLCDSHDVAVFQTLQAPGEFVVTWPRAYHAGFSHGYNVGEAVNFGTDDWVSAGRAAVDEYAAGRGKRDAVFSHDRLLMETATRFAKKMRRNGGLVQATWIARMAATLRGELSTIIREQEQGRAALMRRGVPRHKSSLIAANAADAADAATLDEDGDACCALCKSMPYLTVVHCSVCWGAAERVEMEAALARAKADGKSAAGAAWAVGAHARPGGGQTGGRYARGGGRRRGETLNPKP